MRSLRLVAIFVFCFLLCLNLTAQTPADQPGAAAATQAPDPDNGLSGSIQGLFIPSIPGQPFRTRATLQLTRQLADGSTVEQKSYMYIARDSTGRVYREGRELVPAGSDMEPSLLRKIVYDPKSLLKITCTPERKVCSQTGYNPGLNPTVEPTGPAQDGKSVLERKDLGTKTIEGLQAIGTREIRTYSPGAFGNDKPVIVTRELWYSPQLQINLAVTRVDPRSGTQKIEAVDMKLGEPAADWFTIPDGYRTVAERTLTVKQLNLELAPLIEKDVPGMSADELRNDLTPVEAAIGAYAKAHASASPNDKNDTFAGRLRERLAADFHMLQQNSGAQVAQAALTEQRLNVDFQQVVTSPCLNKPAPSDPATMPKDEASLREEQRAWVAVRDAWSAFLAKLFPHIEPASFAWRITSERDSDLRSIQNVLRIRGCTPMESIALQLTSVVTNISAPDLAIDVKPVDAAIAAYVKAHSESAPHDRSDFRRMVEISLVADLRLRQQGMTPSRELFEEADLHLNQAYRAIVGSPCLSKPATTDPPNAPVSEEKLRAEQNAWIGVRDAWTAFMAQLYPGDTHVGLGTTFTNLRANELRQMQGIMKNRGCKPDDN